MASTMVATMMAVCTATIASLVARTATMSPLATILAVSRAMASNLRIFSPWGETRISGAREF